MARLAGFEPTTPAFGGPQRDNFFWYNPTNGKTNPNTMSPYDQTQYNNIIDFLNICSFAAILFPFPRFWMRALLVVALLGIGYKAEMKRAAIEQQEQPQSTRDWYEVHRSKHRS